MKRLLIIAALLSTTGAQAQTWCARGQPCIIKQTVVQTAPDHHARHEAHHARNIAIGAAIVAVVATVIAVRASDNVAGHVHILEF